jgi:hypothetical protein
MVLRGGGRPTCFAARNVRISRPVGEGLQGAGARWPGLQGPPVEDDLALGVSSLEEEPRPLGGQLGHDRALVGEAIEPLGELLVRDGFGSGLQPVEQMDRFLPPAAGQPVRERFPRLAPLLMDSR